MSNKKETCPELSAEQVQELRQRRRKARRKRAGVVIDRIFGFLMATVIVVGLACLGLEYVLVKGPSPALRDTFVMTMLETRRFGFIPRIFLTQQEVEEIRALKSVHQNVDFDPTLIQIASENEGEENPAQPLDGQSTGSPYGLVDEDGDGLILEEVHGRGFSGYMLIVLDPTRVVLGFSPDDLGIRGYTVAEFAEKFGAVAAVNGGGFYDPSGMGNGSIPEHLVVKDGVIYCGDRGIGSGFVGLDDKGFLHVGLSSSQEVRDKNIQHGCGYGPILVVNGEPMDEASLSSGLNPRTAIGQRSDGAILLLVIDGRRATSLGASYKDLAEQMLAFGAINAGNLDGGSSSLMWMDGGYINNTAAVIGVRPIPTAFLVMP